MYITKRMYTTEIIYDSTYIVLQIHVSTWGDQVLHNIQMSCRCGLVQWGLHKLKVKHVVQRYGITRKY